jgi:hypothetical protein
MASTTHYDPATRTLVTAVSGVVTLRDVAAWEDDLRRAADEVPEGAEFRALIDIRGYEVADQDRAVHQAMRQVMPTFLARHGFAVGFWGLYGVAPPEPSRPARCRAVAHVHHDGDKMDRYNELLATATERFFVDRDAASAWLAAA